MSVRGGSGLLRDPGAAGVLFCGGVFVAGAAYLDDDGVEPVAGGAGGMAAGVCSGVCAEEC